MSDDKDDERWLKGSALIERFFKDGVQTPAIFFPVNLRPEKCREFLEYLKAQNLVPADARVMPHNWQSNWAAAGHSSAARGIRNMTEQYVRVDETQAQLLKPMVGEVLNDWGKLRDSRRDTAEGARFYST